MPRRSCYRSSFLALSLWLSARVAVAQVVPFAGDADRDQPPAAHGGAGESAIADRGDVAAQSPLDPARLASWIEALRVTERAADEFTSTTLDDEGVSAIAAEWPKHATQLQRELRALARAVDQGAATDLLNDRLAVAAAQLRQWSERVQAELTRLDGLSTRCRQLIATWSPRVAQQPAGNDSELLPLIRTMLSRLSAVDSRLHDRTTKLATLLRALRDAEAEQDAGIEAARARISSQKGLALFALSESPLLDPTRVDLAAMGARASERRHLNNLVLSDYARDNANAYLLQCMHCLVVLLGAALALSAAGVDLAHFSLLVGALGVGIGFGIQTVVNNFICGLILLYERPIKVGDLIEVDGVVGEVRRIGIRSSTVRTFARAEVLMPNASLINSKVTNYTLSDIRRRIELAVGVAYGTDSKRVLQLLGQVAGAHPEVLESPEPQVLFTGFGDSSLNSELRVWVAHYADGLARKSELSVAICDALRAAQIEIPFPQRDLHLRSVAAGTLPERAECENAVPDTIAGAPAKEPRP